MLVQLWTEVPSLQLWPVPALTKWVEALCGGLEGVLLSCSKFCLSSGAEGGKGSVNH